MGDAWSIVDVYMKLPRLPCKGVVFGVFVCVLLCLGLSLCDGHCC